MIGVILGGRYEILEKIGEGGMSEVYKAKCHKLNRFVAVKVLKKQFADNEEISQKFKKEATAIANLSDANIVNILDVGTQDTIDYIVMEYINGKTLKDLIKFNGKLSYTTAINIALQIAKALDCAHRNNIIHRDIKPQNILVTESGEIKVTDFGIAKSVDSQTITNTTSVIGSAHYLSPEQARGTYIDFRTDIYSLGVVLYEMVTGVLPFEGDSPVTVALKHIQEDPIPPKNLNSSIPSSLNNLILKAIQKEPIKRYINAKELIQDLNKIKENPDVIIGDNKEQNDERTIVMSPILGKNQNKEKENYIQEDTNEDDDYYDDEEYDDEDDEDLKEKPKKKKNVKKKVFITIGSILGVILLLFVGYYLAVGGGNSEVEVPKLVGLKSEDAVKELEKIGLRLEIIKTEVSDKEENTILSIDPKEGTKVKKNTSIKAVVSGGEETYNMPDFRNYEITNIKHILETQGFSNYTITEEFSDDVEYGYLIRQNPAAKTKIKKDAAIQIIISKGPEVKLVEVPSVVGKSEKDGKGELQALKLTVTVETKTTYDKAEDGIILSQSISGNKVEEGTPITIIVGKFEERIIDVRKEIGLSEGQTLSVAKARLEVAGLGIDIKGPKDDDAIVVSFTETVKEGGTVTLNTQKEKNQQEENKPQQ